MFLKIDKWDKLGSSDCILIIKTLKYRIVNNVIIGISIGVFY